MKLPRGKVKLKVKCGTGTRRKVEILYKTSEREDKIKFLDPVWDQKEK